MFGDGAAVEDEDLIEGGIFNETSNPTLTNCILCNNTAITSGNEIFNDSSDPNFSYCDIADSGGSEGSWDSSLGTDDDGNIDADGADDTPGTEDDNLRISAGSPCIDAGDPNYVLDPNYPTNLDGLDRIVDANCDGTATVDIGAYEFDWLYLGDFADGCDINLYDFSVLALNWLQDNPAIDIAPYLEADGIINLKDLLILAKHWLEGTIP